MGTSLTDTSHKGTPLIRGHLSSGEPLIRGHLSSGETSLQGHSAKYGNLLDAEIIHQYSIHCMYIRHLPSLDGHLIFLW